MFVFDIQDGNNFEKAKSLLLNFLQRDIISDKSVRVGAVMYNPIENINSLTPDKQFLAKKVDKYKWTKENNFMRALFKAKDILKYSSSVKNIMILIDQVYSVDVAKVIKELQDDHINPISIFLGNNTKSIEEMNDLKEKGFSVIIDVTEAIPDEMVTQLVPGSANLLINKFNIY